MARIRMSLFDPEKGVEFGVTTIDLSRRREVYELSADAEIARANSLSQAVIESVNGRGIEPRHLLDRLAGSGVSDDLRDWLYEHCKARGNR